MKERQSSNMMRLDPDPEVVHEHDWLQMDESMAWCSWCGSMHWSFEFPLEKFSVKDVIASVEHITMTHGEKVP
jgi:hypothetical protein